MQCQSCVLGMPVQHSGHPAAGHRSASKQHPLCGTFTPGSDWISPCGQGPLCCFRLVLLKTSGKRGCFSLSPHWQQSWAAGERHVVQRQRSGTGDQRLEAVDRHSVLRHLRGRLGPGASGDLRLVCSANQQWQRGMLWKGWTRNPVENPSLAFRRLLCSFLCPDPRRRLARAGSVARETAAAARMARAGLKFCEAPCFHADTLPGGKVRLMDKPHPTARARRVKTRGTQKNKDAGLRARNGGDRQPPPHEKTLLGKKREFAAPIRRPGNPGANQCEESKPGQTGLM